MVSALLCSCCLLNNLPDLKNRQAMYFFLLLPDLMDCTVPLMLALGKAKQDVAWTLEPGIKVCCWIRSV